MKKTVLVFGLISGGILAAVMAGGMVLYKNGRFDFDHSEIIGYTSMLLAFIVVFFGIRSYRENNSGGAITFGKAFQVGLYMTLISCAIYIITWEIIYYGWVPDFADQCFAHEIAKMRASGASAAALAKTTADMAHFREIYKNPFVNVGMTFLEIFPLGLVMTLISAAILRKKASEA
jgi:hypothetical protein